MNPATEIRIPREIVNDDTVKIAAWEVAEGAAVKRGQVVAAIETSKAVIDLEAEGDGYLEIVHPKGAEIPIGELIGWIQPQPVTARAAKTNITPPSGNGTASSVQISNKARVLIEQHGINPAVFAGIEMVRESDVLAYLEQQKSQTAVAVIEEPPAQETPPQPEKAIERVTPSQPPVKRGLLHDARVSAADRGGKGLVGLAWNYLWRNWFLGNLVRWAPRGVILVIHRLRGVKIGSDCYIDPNALLETAYPENITIGNDVRVTARAVIMTHIKAPHYLRETGIMPLVLKPVVLEDHTFIGVNAVIMPGVTVGKASVVASGAVVMTNVPPFTMVAGNPAKVVKNFPRPGEKG